MSIENRKEKSGFWGRLGRLVVQPKLAAFTVFTSCAIIAGGTSEKDGGSFNNILQELLNPRWHALGWVAFVIVLGAILHRQRRAALTRRAVA